MPSDPIKLQVLTLVGGQIDALERLVDIAGLRLDDDCELLADALRTQRATLDVSTDASSALAVAGPHVESAMRRELVEEPVCAPAVGATAHGPTLCGRAGAVLLAQQRHEVSCGSCLDVLERQQHELASTADHVDPAPPVT